jgi:hypothetical protein
LKKDGFLPCYVEALAFWIGGNVLLAFVESALLLVGWRSNPLGYTLADRLVRVYEPNFLVASGVLIIPLFAAILVGSRSAP